MDVKILLLFVLLGLSSAEPLRGRIVGGSLAGAGQFPFQAAIRKSLDEFICNGFIINEFYIGTSAFCVKDYVPNELEVLLGTNSLSSGGVVYRISEITLHPTFVADLHLNDVAVLRTDSQIVFDTRVRAINLGTSIVVGGATVSISGWGKTSHLHVQVADGLNFILKQVLTNSDCIARVSAMGRNPNVVFDNTFCTFNGVGQGNCLGDAGSPIVMNNQVVGINSWDDSCGLGSPDIHTRMSYFRSWFIDVTRIEEEF